MSFLLSKMTSSNTSGYVEVEGDGLGLTNSSTPAPAKAAFLVKPVDDNLAVKTGYAVLSVTHEGFSLDREMGEGVADQWPMLVVPMQKVHSWVSVGGHFALRHHHGASGGSVHVNTFEMKKSKDLDNLMRAVDDAVAAYKELSESALAARAIEHADFASLVKSLEALETPSRVQHLKTSLSGGGGPASDGSRTLSSNQAQALMKLVDEGFDSIEAACFLHGICIEHAGKTALLNALGAEDRETAVARIRDAARK